MSSTGFHPLDGALFLRDVIGAEGQLCSLVAYHSCAEVGLEESMRNQLADEFVPVGGLLADALTFCDMTTSPDGEPVEVEARLAEIVERYGPGHTVTRAITLARPEILRAVGAVRALQGSASAG